MFDQNSFDNESMQFQTHEQAHMYMLNLTKTWTMESVRFTQKSQFDYTN